MRTAGLIVVCLAWPAIAPAEWYQWRDADGTLHVADQVSAPAQQQPKAVSRIEYGGAAAAPAKPPAASSAPVHTLATAPAAGAADPAGRGDDPEADRRQRLQRRLQNNLRHLAMIGSAPGGDPARAELQNSLTDAVRADREALAALDRGAIEP